MGNVNGAGATSGVNTANICSPQEDVDTVRKDEKSFADVSKRLQIPEKDLRAANPGLKQLQPGMDICLPNRPHTAESSGSDQKKIPTAENQSKPAGGTKIPKGRVGDYEVPLPKPMTGTTDAYDRGGTDSSRKLDQERIDNARRRDDRDLDPKTIEDDRKKKIDNSAKIVDRAVKDGMKNTSGGKIDRDLEKESKDKMMQDMSRRIRTGIRG